jgi:hypothetical protein
VINDRSNQNPKMFKNDAIVQPAINLLIRILLITEKTNM